MQGDALVKRTNLCRASTSVLTLRLQIRPAHSQSDSQEARNGAAHKLSDELHFRLGTNQVAGLQVTGHIRALGCGTASDDTSDQVEPHTIDLSQMLSLCDTTKDELRGLGDGRDWVDVGVSGGLDSDEGEEETEDVGEDDFTDVHVELSGDEGDGEQHRDGECAGPCVVGNAVLRLSEENEW